MDFVLTLTEMFPENILLTLVFTTSHGVCSPEIFSASSNSMQTFFSHPVLLALYLNLHAACTFHFHKALFACKAYLPWSLRHKSFLEVLLEKDYCHLYTIAARVFLTLRCL
jgi:hypothetical protein